MFQRFLSEHSLAEYTFRSDIFPTVRDRVFWEASLTEDHIKKAEKALEYRWPVILATDFMEFKKSGNRLIMEQPHFDRRNHLMSFVLAELKENKGRFIPQIVNGLFAICEESYWGVSAHWAHRDVPQTIPTPAEPYIDLFAAETAEHLVMIAHLLREPLLAFCPEILDRVEYELEVRVKAPYLNHRDFWWMGYGGESPNNWNPWILSNVLTVFLLTERGERRVRRAISKMLTEAQHYYNRIPEDGGCDEGPVYWGRAGASLFEFLYQLKLASNGALDLFTDEKIALIAAYMQKAHVVADIFVNVADAHAKSLASLMPLLFGFAKETKQTELMNFSAAVYRMGLEQNTHLVHASRVGGSTLRRWVFEATFTREILEFPVKHPLHGALECLPQMQLAVLRKGTWCLYAKGGHNGESHNHNDVGSFALYEERTPVLVDIGIGTYTRDTFSSRRYETIPWVRSAYHNLPLIHDTEQVNGAQYRASGFETSEEAITVTFPDAYPEAARVAKLTRTMTLCEHGACINDRMRATDGGPCRVCEVLMCVLPVRIENETAIIGDRFRLTAPGGKFGLEQIPFADNMLCSDWGVEYATRITVTYEAATQITINVEKI